MLNISIDTLINQLADNSLAVSDEAFPKHLSELLLQDLDRLHQVGAFQQAAIGRGGSLQVQKQIRGDQTYWLDENPDSQTQKDFLDFMRELQKKLNESFFIGLQEIEAHYALYPPGAGYDKHIDQHAHTAYRKITFILYLNPQWQPGDGGELLIFDPQNPEQVLTQIQPLFGRFILFRSEVFPHQVATSGRDRKSLTGWLRA